MTLLDKALKFAMEKHEGQFDKAGEKYILHPLHVALQMHTEEEKIIALLHDVLEDTDATEEDLRDLGLSEETIGHIKVLTRAEDMTYNDYIENISKDKVAKKIKLKDLEHNMDTSRLKGDKEKTERLMKRYESAYKYLKEDM
jgi:(p)ppGpp synthase/HD superfamily hydrolase